MTYTISSEGEQGLGYSIQIERGSTSTRHPDGVPTALIVTHCTDPRAERCPVLIADAEMIIAEAREGCWQYMYCGPDGARLTWLSRDASYYR